jgi:hypothetical protein
MNQKLTKEEKWEVCFGISTFIAVILAVLYLNLFLSIKISNYIMKYYPPPHGEILNTGAALGIPGPTQE